MAIHRTITKYKSLALALKDFEQFVRDARHLTVGKPIPRFEFARPRELLANWLVCAAMNSVVGTERYTFTSDADGDGIVLDTATGNTWPTEHVIALPAHKLELSIQDHLLNAVRKKIAKGGHAYASGKTLVIFLESGESSWHPNRVARELPNPLHFDTVWVTGLCEVVSGNYVYGVASLDLSAGDAPAFRVAIGPEFDRWEVSRIQ